MRRTIDAAEITAAVSKLAQEACVRLPDDVADALDAMAQREQRPLCRSLLEQFGENRRIAVEQNLPLCQDTGVAVVFVELGQEAEIVNGLLTDAINAGVAQGYGEGYLRKSMVTPLERENSGDNTPAVIHLQLVAGDKLQLTLLPKGGGAENMSRLAMLKPSQGWDGVRDFVVETVRLAGANPCPPVVVGVGVGGDFEQCALLAKTALLRQMDEPARDRQWRAREKELLEAVNATGVGVQGFGGENTALAVHIESMPCHLASLPVAVNLNCHVERRATITL